MKEMRAGFKECRGCRLIFSLKDFYIYNKTNKPSPLCKKCERERRVISNQRALDRRAAERTEGVRNFARIAMEVSNVDWSDAPIWRRYPFKF